MLTIQQKIEAVSLPLRMLLQVHDELVFEVRADEAERHAEWIKEHMSGAIKLDVPLKVDVAIGPNWLSGK
jgi:DNA polymerase-1